MTGCTNWRLIQTGLGSAAWNMAVDEALIKNFKKGDLPILRLYSWEPSLSLGRFSRTEESIDRDECERQSLFCVRRMTGGGVLVHGNELSYSLVLPRDALYQMGVKESYRYLCRFLVRLYARLGLKADFAADLNLDTKESDICLAGVQAYDIVIEGKKIGGNAQRYTREALFQHGSIPIQVDRSRFDVLCHGDSGLENAAMLEELGYTLSHRELESLLIDVFCSNFHVCVQKESLSKDETEDAYKLLADKYTQQRWNIDAK